MQVLITGVDFQKSFHLYSTLGYMYAAFNFKNTYFDLKSGFVVTIQTLNKQFFKSVKSLALCEHTLKVVT